MRASILLSIAGICVASLVGAETVPFRVHGQAWDYVGRIMQSSDTLLGDGATPIELSHNSMQSLGGQITLEADLGEHWKGAFGIGAYQAANALGTYQGSNTASPNFLNASTFKPYIAEANLTYLLGSRENPWFSVTVGNFAFDYNSDVKDLGLYLLRGPVYPGLLMSGFRQFETDSTKSTQTGFHLHHSLGNLSQDLLLINERELPPTYDWSVAYIAKYRALNALEIGAGVNFYRLIPYSERLETPGRVSGNGVALDGTSNFEEVSPGDTVFYTHQGIKLMARFALDLKRWLSFGNMGAEDFKLYGEAAILGVKDYGSYYDDVMERMPIMGGFNIPTFGVLDFLSVEVEWYGSPYKNDLYNIGNPSSIVGPWQNQNPPVPSPVPVLPGAYKDSTRDDVKWAVVVQKTVAKHVRFTAQVANDHYRAAPVVSDGAGITSVGGTASALTSPGDWYFMFRLGFFF